MRFAVLLSLGGLALLFCAIFQPAISKPPSPQSITVIPSTNKPTVAPTLSPTLSPSLTSQPLSTPTAQWQVEVTELAPATHRITSTPVRDVVTALWTDDKHFIYGFTYRQSSATPLEWILFDFDTASESPISSPIKNDNTFWERNNLNTDYQYRELAGYFSPSGNYVIYTNGKCTWPDTNVRAEIWISEAHGSTKFKIYDWCSSLNNITWYDNERKVLFTDDGGEGGGAVQFYSADLASRTVTPLDIVTEGASQLSPDGNLLAFVPAYDGRLALYSLSDKNIEYIDHGGIRSPVWSADGKLLYYWWGAQPGFIPDVTEIRTFNVETGVISTVFDEPSLLSAFHNYEGDNIKVVSKYYMGDDFAVSPNGNKFLFWDNGFFLVIKK